MFFFFAGIWASRKEKKVHYLFLFCKWQIFILIVSDLTHFLAINSNIGSLFEISRVEWKHLLKGAPHAVSHGGEQHWFQTLICNLSCETHNKYIIRKAINWDDLWLLASGERKRNGVGGTKGRRTPNAIEICWCVVRQIWNDSIENSRKVRSRARIMRRDVHLIDPLTMCRFLCTNEYDAFSTAVMTGWHNAMSVAQWASIRSNHSWGSFLQMRGWWWVLPDVCCLNQGEPDEMIVVSLRNLFYNCQFRRYCCSWSNLLYETFTQ